MTADEYCAAMRKLGFLNRHGNQSFADFAAFSKWIGVSLKTEQNWAKEAPLYLVANANAPRGLMAI
jgi:hypothetical protein